MWCNDEDWYFVMLSLDRNELGTETYTFRVTRYAGNDDLEINDFTSPNYDRSHAETATILDDQWVAPTDGYLVLGSAGNSDPYVNPYWGRIDDFAIWKKALTSDEYENLRDCYGIPTPMPTPAPSNPPSRARGRPPTGGSTRRCT